MPSAARPLSLALILFSQVAGATPMTAGAEAYVYGYPLVLMDATKEGSTGPDRICGFDADINSFKHLYEIPDSIFEAVVRPNVDTLYSSAFLDLSAGPLVLDMPPTDDRYVLLALFDAWSNNFDGLGTPSHQTQGGTYLLVQDGWQGTVPDGITRVVTSPTPLVWVIGRTEVRGPDDQAAANAVQDGFSLTPLTPPTTPWPSYPCSDPNADTLAPPAQVAQLEGIDFLAKLDALIDEQGTLPLDEPTLERLGSIGVGPYATTSLEDLGTIERNRVEAGVANGRSSVQAGVNATSNTTGWSPSPRQVELGEYDDSYYVRAVVAEVGFGANKQDYAVYQNTGTDADGATLDGDAVYTLTFPSGQLPPVRAFWSITVYDDDGYLTDNPIDRFALGTNSGLVPESDGSVVLTIANQQPVGVPDANWLPAPAETFQLTLRMYEPEPEILDETWTAPEPVRVTP